MEMQELQGRSIGQHARQEDEHQNEDHELEGGHGKILESGEGDPAMNSL
jgi:hypothetical protein